MSNGLTQFNPASHLIWLIGALMIGGFLLFVTWDVLAELVYKLRNRRDRIPPARPPSDSHPPAFRRRLFRRATLPWRTSREGRLNDPPVKPRR
jgi:hypothetical protein